jgi:hypothetical protein
VHVDRLAELLAGAEPGLAEAERRHDVQGSERRGEVVTFP